MSLRFLAFPSSEERALDFKPLESTGLCAVAGPGGVPLADCNSWEALLAKLPQGFTPEWALLDLCYPSLPAWVWDAPVPLVALAPDWAMQWPFLRLALARCQLAFSDRAGVRALPAAGIANVREARLFGLRAAFAAPPAGDAPPRDIDVLFAGNVNPSVQGERLPWLARLAKLSTRFRVHIASAVFGEDYRRLLRRARLVFNRTHHGEENQRLAEAAACGALVLQERGCEETEGVWLDGVQVACYGEDDLEQVIERWLGDEPARAEAAARGEALARQRSFASELERIAGVVADESENLKAKRAALASMSSRDLLLLRCWQRAGAQSPADLSLPQDLEGALADPQGPAWAALGLAALAMRDDSAQAARALHAGLGRAPGSAMLALWLADALARLGEGKLAAEGACRLLASLPEREIPEEEAMWPLADPSFGPFRMAWQQAGIGKSREQEKAERLRLMRWKLHSIIAAGEQGISAFHEAAIAWPGAPGVRAALGCALARAGRFADAAPHLRAECEAHPFDLRAARALFQALSDAGLAQAAARFAEERRLLAQAAPKLVPEEPWFAPRAAAHGPSTAPPAIEARLADVSWEGPLSVVSSLAIVNRKVALGLAARGLDVALRDVPSHGGAVPEGAERQALEALLAKGPRQAAVTVRHAWPPDPVPPASGHWVLAQPWEFGSLPRQWLPMLAQVDEAWVPTSFVKQAFLDAGMPADRVRVIPHGADPAAFRPEREPLRLEGAPGVRFLFVGGTIPRKGFDILLRAFARAFRKGDGASLVVKGMGSGTFYKGQTAEQAIAEFKADPANPELVLLDGDMGEEELASLYAACDCLVLPCRGEGFGLPLAEAMSSGLPVVATGMGAALDFVDESVGWLVPATRRELPEGLAGGLETVGTPWLAEPDEAALAALLREIAASPEERRKRGAEGRRRVEQGLSWSHAVEASEAALREVRARPVRRFAPKGPMASVEGFSVELHDPARDVWISRPLVEGAAYESLAVAAMRSLVRPGDKVLDVGANIGLFSLELSRLVGPHGKVFAVEPEAGNLALLRRNLGRNGCANVEVLPVAASDREGTVRLWLSASNQGDHRLAPAVEARESVEVACARLDTLLENEGPFALIKIDVQGAEALALAGMRCLLERSPQAALLLEAWPAALERAGASPAALLEGLEAEGFSLEVLDDVLGRPVPVTAKTLMAGMPKDPEAFANLLARKKHAPAMLPAQAPQTEGPIPAGGPPPLPGAALCIITKDEEANIGDCIRSCAGLFPEIVVVDTGSKDRTREIALSLGAKVFDFPWIDDFSAARNETLRHATREWAFWMDADDRLDDENREKLRAILASLPAANAAYSMKCRCLPDPETGTDTTVDHLRLFRRLPGVRWKYRIHEQILGSLRTCGAEVRFADVTIDHTGYADPALRGRKLQRDLRILEAQRQDMPGEPFTLFNLGATYLETGRHEEALPVLEASLAASHPTDSIVRKLHSLVAHCHERAGRRREALAAVLRGLRDCPRDAELRLLEGTMRIEQKDFHGAKAALAGLIASEPEPAHFGSVAEGLRTFRARHALAQACLALGEEAEAEALWRRACAEAPNWRPPRSALAALLVRQGRWDEAAEQAALLEALPCAEAEAAWLRGRALMARGDAAAAAALLGGAASRFPEDGSVRMLHSLALEQAGDPGEAERQLEQALALRPRDAGLASERDRLRRQREARDLPFLPPGGLAG